MNYWKDKLEEWEELGISSDNPGDSEVCDECIGDPAIAEHIKDNATEKSCSYCGRTSDKAFAMPLIEVVEFMAEVLKEEWSAAVSELPVDGGEYVGDALDAHDLLDEIGFEPDNADVLKDVAECLSGRTWCKRDYFAASPSDRTKIGWERFCEEVKHSRRYTFWTSLDDSVSEYHPDYLPPGNMLAEINEVITGLDLIKEFPKGTRFCRVQEHATGASLETPARFTSPPRTHANQPNRMSPAGIPMFYGTEDFETAVLEVAGKDPKPGHSASGVLFESQRPLQILDLIVLGRRVSYFADGGREWRHEAEFLRFFSREISKPIDRDQRQHIDYVPSQVFTEYVRHEMKTAKGQPIDGIRYFSARNRRPSYVLFLDQDDCLKSRQNRPQSLAFVPDSLKTVGLETAR